MGMINISTGGSFFSRNKSFGAMKHGHAHAVQEAIQFLVEEVLPDAIDQDHELHELGKHPAEGFLRHE